MNLFTTDIKSIPNAYLHSITYSDGFETSKRFLRYREDIKTKIGNFLSSMYGVVATKNGEILNVGKGALNKVLSYPEYFKNGAITYFTYCLNCVTNDIIEDSDIPLDVTNLPHVCRYSALWKDEARLYAMLSSSGDEDLYDGKVIIHCLEDYLSRNSRVPSVVVDADTLMEREFTELCFDFIREKEVSQDINDVNWYRSCQLTTDAEVFNFIKRYTTVLTVSLEGVMKTLISLYREQINSKDDPLLIQNATLKATEAITRKELEQTTSKLNKKIDSLEKKLNAERSKNSEYKKQISKARTESNKQYKTELHDLDKQVKDLQNEYNELNKKYQESLERIQILEDLVEEQEDETVTSDTNYCEEFYQKRFVFARNKHTERYSIMKELGELFPNAVFTDKFSDLKPDLIDGIVFLTRYEKHGVYYKARDLCKTNNIKSVHCDTSNTERILSMMYNKFILEDNVDRSSYKS